MKLEENFITIDDKEIEVTPDLFFDSYAFFEILKGNKNYKKYGALGIVTTKLNMFELYFGVLRETDVEEAEKVIQKYFTFVVDFDEDVIKEAAKLKILLNKRNVSMTDCIGYCLAKQLGIKFLTGDKQFEKMENVEYVK